MVEILLEALGLRPYAWVLTARGWWVWCLAGVVFFGVCLLAGKLQGRVAPTPKIVAIEGAHFATTPELQQHGFTGTTGIFVGKAHGVEVRVPRGHLILIGPSECGKSESIAHSVEVEWTGCILSLELKGSTVAKRRRLHESRGKRVYLFEPRASVSDHVNELDRCFIPWGDEAEIAGVQRVSNHLVPPASPNASEGVLFYQRRERAILEALFLYYGNFGPRPPSFGQVRYAMRTMAPERTLQAMLKTDHPIVKAVGQELLRERAPTRTLLWNGVMDYLRVYDDPVLARNTDDTTIPLATLQQDAQESVVYIRITPDDARGALRPTVRLLLDQHIERAGARPDPGAFRHHELVKLDDQFELGYLAAANHISAFYREHGLWLLSVFQSFEQLESSGYYGGLLDNSKTWVVFRPNHPSSAAFLSDKLGTQMVFTEQVTRRGPEVATTVISRERRLMSPYDVAHIPNFTAFVFHGECPPMLLSQVPYTRRRLRQVG